MQTGSAPLQPTDRLARLLSYAEADPGNIALLEDAADEALYASAYDTLDTLLARLDSLGVRSGRVANIEGLAALRHGDSERAVSIFSRLLEADSESPELKFNLAWAKALLGDFATVAALIDDETANRVPRAASLRVQALQHLGDLEHAVAEGQRLIALRPGDDDLLGTVAIAAMDLGDAETARRLSAQATRGADALATQGMFALDDDRPDVALARFEAALAEQPQAPRAMLGLGLARLAQNDPASAAAALDSAAEIFTTHLGSWVAAGWAYYLAGDRTAARARFETAERIDGNFAEIHGALAVIELAEGDNDKARERAEVARRLDANSFGGMLARVMLMEADGQADRAARIVEHAMQMPVRVDGKTLGAAIARIGRTQPPAGRQ